MQEKLFLALMMMSSTLLAAQEIASVKVRSINSGDIQIAEGMVEAVQQSAISAQVSGRITELTVRAGDSVKKGQLLLKIDNQAASQQANVSQAQVSSARAQLQVASKEYERQQYLFKKNYLSQAALDQAEAQFKATEAALRGSTAQAGAANTQTGFYTLTAPYSGIVADVSATVGETALPGKPLLTLYEPGDMRVVASLPQSKVSRLAPNAAVRLELPALPETQRWQQATSVTALPTADSGSQSVPVRLALPATVARVTPGMFARAYFPLTGDQQERLMIPFRTVVRRTELTAVYVVAPEKQPQLRQVRLGRRQGNEVEVLAGLVAGESIAVDPISASRGQ